jgi:phage recombination protein Bet
MNAVTKTNLPALQMPENELIDVLRNSLYPGAKPESIKLVLGYCRARGLDPMKKPVHVVPMYNREAGGMIDVVMPGVNSYRTDASRTGEYVGKDEPEFGPDTTKTIDNVSVTFPLWCKVTVRRFLHGEARAFTAKEFWIENYASGKQKQGVNDMWQKRPYGQLAKCAEAQALRMAFPEETGGTNTNDEMEGKFTGPTIEGEVVRQPTTPRSVPAADIPSLDDGDVLRDRVDRLIVALAACSSEMRFVAYEAKAKALLADIDASDRDELKDMAVSALAAARARFEPEAATAYADEDAA